MTDLLHRLALEPRTSNVSVQDSVVMTAVDEKPPKVRTPTIAERPSRKIPKIPNLGIFSENDEHWIEAFNAEAA